MGKYTSWYESQNETTKAWLSKQAIWHDRDMIISWYDHKMTGWYDDRWYDEVMIWCYGDGVIGWYDGMTV